MSLCLAYLLGLRANKILAELLDILRAQITILNANSLGSQTMASRNPYMEIHRVLGLTSIPWRSLCSPLHLAAAAASVRAGANAEARDFIT